MLIHSFLQVSKVAPLICEAGTAVIGRKCWKHSAVQAVPVERVRVHVNSVSLPRVLPDLLSVSSIYLLWSQSSSICSFLFRFSLIHFLCPMFITSFICMDLSNNIAEAPRVNWSIQAVLQRSYTNQIEGLSRTSNPSCMAVKPMNINSYQIIWSITADISIFNIIIALLWRCSPDICKIILHISLWPQSFGEIKCIDGSFLLFESLY